MWGDTEQGQETFSQWFWYLLFRVSLKCEGATLYGIRLFTSICQTFVKAAQRSMKFISNGCPQVTRVVICYCYDSQGVATFCKMNNILHILCHVNKLWQTNDMIFFSYTCTVFKINIFNFETCRITYSFHSF